MYQFAHSSSEGSLVASSLGRCKWTEGLWHAHAGFCVDASSHLSRADTGSAIAGYLVRVVGLYKKLPDRLRSAWGGRCCFTCAAGLGPGPFQGVCGHVSVLWFAGPERHAMLSISVYAAVCRLCIFFGKVLVWVCAHLKTVFCFLVEFSEFFVCSEWVCCRMSCAGIFSQSEFCPAEVFHFNDVQLSVTDCPWLWYQECDYHPQGHLGFLLSSWSFWFCI